MYKNIKKGDPLEIKYIHIISEKTPIKIRKIFGLCTNIKKSKTNPVLTLKIILLNEIITLSFCINSPLILKINKVTI